jgi:hypothetical protein
LGISALKEASEDEDKKQSETLENVQPKAAFYRLMGRAVAKQHLSTLARLWVGPVCNLEIEITAGEFRATGSYDRPLNALSLAFLPNSATPGPTVRNHVEYVGTIFGRRIRGTVRRYTDDDLQPHQSVLSSTQQDRTPFLMVSDDQKGELQVMEHIRKPIFYKIIKAN